MSRIIIPFNTWSKERLAEGRKTKTSRTKPYGKIGDIFEVDGKLYILTDVYLRKLKNVRDFCFLDEGAYSPEEFEKVWRSIFRGQFDPEKMVWVHEFMGCKA